MTQRSSSASSSPINKFDVFDVKVESKTEFDVFDFKVESKTENLPEIMLRKFRTHVKSPSPPISKYDFLQASVFRSKPQSKVVCIDLDDDDDDDVEAQCTPVKVLSKLVQVDEDVDDTCFNVPEELNKHNNGAQASQPVQKTQSHMPQKVDIYSQVKGPEKRGCVHCIGNIPKPKKPKASLSENQELRDELKKMRASLEKM
ncbi:uncharacterized protein [Medicago truncatula]|uniref:Uncharacterized protein n=1 Tax=Medicago truncatula TaxID=3880 RepID=A0A072UTS7_MEDTR|nr:uncharacterized protein LOC25494201 [Medicago truncatula]KEH32473.1 hypothetical protein MTR_4g125750 [Medicago truncatula]